MGCILHLRQGPKEKPGLRYHIYILAFSQICFEKVDSNAASEVHVHKVFFQTHYSFTCSCIACQLDLPRTENLPEQVDLTLTKLNTNQIDLVHF